MTLRENNPEILTAEYVPWLKTSEPHRGEDATDSVEKIPNSRKVPGEIPPDTMKSPKALASAKRGGDILSTPEVDSTGPRQLWQAETTSPCTSGSRSPDEDNSLPPDASPDPSQPDSLSGLTQSPAPVVERTVIDDNESELQSQLTAIAQSIHPSIEKARIFRAIHDYDKAMEILWSLIDADRYNPKYLYELYDVWRERMRKTSKLPLQSHMRFVWLYVLLCITYKLQDWKIANQVDWWPLAGDDEFMSITLYARKCDCVSLPSYYY
jgi:hypothetical protein